jgi:anthranilate phosphoribosyltransferase
MEAFKPLLAKVATGASLSRAEAETAFDDMLSGEVTPAQMGAFLMALRVRGETVDEITGAVAAMRRKMLVVKAPGNAVDIVGTGGDGSGSYNVSTLASLIVASCGVPVAKHGNRAASSKSGSIGLSPEKVEACIRDANIGFMMAPTHHAATRHVGPARSELGTRTIFNILGPLSNPAGVKRQLVGVFSRSMLEPMANVLGNLGSERVWLVHGSDGLDEITTTGPTHVASLENGKVTSFDITPEDAGLTRAKASDLRGGDPAHNASALTAVLDGLRSPYRDIAVINAAAALIVAGKARTLAEGAELAGAALDKGAAKETLKKLVDVSNRG